MAQEQDILEHMRTKGPITPLVALQEYGCFRLPARIYNLKNEGIEIHDQMVEYTNERGETKRFKEYWIPGGAR